MFTVEYLNGVELIYCITLKRFYEFNFSQNEEVFDKDYCSKIKYPI